MNERLINVKLISIDLHFIHSLNYFYNHAVCLIFILVIAQSLTRTGEKGSFEQESTDSIMLLISRDGPPIVWPAVLFFLISPLSSLIFVELALEGKFEHFVSTVLF